MDFRDHFDWVLVADVRRLVSEGTRPKLPRASKVDWLINAPSQILSLLDRLYVVS